MLGVFIAAALGFGALIALKVIDLGGEPAKLPDDWQRGMNLTAFLPEAYSDPKAQEALRTAKDAGTDLVALTPTSYMANSTSSQIEADPAKTPSDQSVLAVAADAHSMGLQVAIKPHVDVVDGTFRGEIQPSDRAAWFESYGNLVDRYAALAQQANADVFVIGTELTTMTGSDGDTEAWRALIQRARSAFDGRITFAANWVQGAQTIDFWDDLDYVGIDAYMPLKTRNAQDPSVDALVTAWRPYVAAMKKLNEEWNKPVLFTELGYESRLGTAARINQGSAQISQEAQANAYEAAFRALSPLPWFAGIWWWEWSAERIGIGPSDGGFNPEGKQAESVLKDWQKG